MNEQTKRVPKIRFPGFADDWEKRKLDDLCIFEKGKGLSKNDLEEDGKYPCILYGQLFTEYGMFIDTIISKTNALDDSFKISEEGDVLIPRCDTTPDGLGRATSLSLDGVILGFDINILKIKNRKQLDSKYLSASLNHHKKELLSKVVGNTVRHLENKEIKDIYIDFPTSLSEQSKIGQLFHSIDNLFTLHQRKLDNIKNLKTCMFQKMFPKEGEKAPEIRFPGFTGNWEQRKLSDEFAEFIVPMRDKPKEFGGTIPWTRIEDIEGKYLNGTLSGQYVSEETIRKMNLKIIPKDSLIVSSSATFGVVAVVTQDLITNQTFIGLVPNDKDTIDYWYSYFQSDEARRYMKLQSAGSTIFYISRESFENMPITLPSKEEAIKIGEFLTNIDNTITLHQRKLDQMKLFKQGLLQQMFV